MQLLGETVRILDIQDQYLKYISINQVKLFSELEIQPPLGSPPQNADSI